MSHPSAPARRSCLAVVCAFLVGAAVQAHPSAGDPPPPIEFPNWKRVSEEDELPEYSVRFPSAVQTRYAANNVVPLTVFLPKDAKSPVPVVVILHYWGARDLRTERDFGKELASRNVAAVIVTLPFHLERSPAGFPSGALALRPDPANKNEDVAGHLVATMTQSVMDVRRTVDWIDTRLELDKSRVGIVGISLGAIVASYAYAVDRRFGPCSFMLGGADLAHILWNSSIIVPERETMRKQGYTAERLREALTPIEPLKVLPGREQTPAFVIGAKHDTIVPPDDTQKLIDALPGAKTLWLDTGHYGGIFVQKRLVRIVSQYFASEFEGRPFTPPTAIYAPTIRIGGVADTAEGFQIAVSLDLWRSGDKGDYFGAFTVTPKGAQFFLGKNLTGGIAPGIFVGTDKIGFGAFWNIVL